MADPDRNVLWACAVDLAFQTSELRAFDLRTGALEASYPIPDGGLCADIALARGAVYVTDTLNGRILRLRRARGTLEVWSDDQQFRDEESFLKINGIAFDGRRTFYTTNYSTGELFAVRIGPGGSAEERSRSARHGDDEPRRHPLARRLPLRRRERSGLTRVDPLTGTRIVLDASLDQPSSLVFVGGDIWITEGQTIRFQTGEAPNLPSR